MTVKVKGANPGGSGAAAARGTKGARKRGGPGRRGRRSKKKGKLKCGENGTYGELNKKYADGKERDHIPSCAALIANATNNLNGGEELCPAQEDAIRNAAQACAIPKGVHELYSKTFKWKNNKEQIAKDSNKRGGKKRAANRDTAAIKDGLKKSGASKECKREYAAWAKKVNGRTQKWYEDMLRKAIKKGT